MMWSLNFSALKTESPQFSRAWAILEEWLAVNQTARVISPSALAQFAKSRYALNWNDASNLALALESLAVRGKVHRLFAVESASGQLLFPYYVSRSKIPDQVRGQSHEWMSTAGAEIMPVFANAEIDVSELS